jgi:hypothetical protein
MDGAKEFHSPEMLDFCRDNKLVMQAGIAYNHTAMCRVESYRCCQIALSRISRLNAHVPLRFHGDAAQDFVIKRNFTWYSQKRHALQYYGSSAHAPCLCRHDPVCVYSLNLSALESYLLPPANTLLSRALLLVIASSKTSICSLTLPGHLFISEICTGNKK